jgi:hypothetical protein
MFPPEKSWRSYNRWDASRPGSTALMVKDLSKPRRCGSSDDWGFLKSGRVRRERAPRLEIPCPQFLKANAHDRKMGPATQDVIKQLMEKDA